jgi:hypothetical protein
MKKKNSKKERNYEVGRGKTPKNTRFGGSSANPRGVRQKSKIVDPMDIFASIHEEEVSVQINGKNINMSRSELTVRQMFQDILQGKKPPKQFWELLKKYSKFAKAEKLKQLEREQRQEAERIRKIELTEEFKIIKEARQIAETAMRTLMLKKMHEESLRKYGPRYNEYRIPEKVEFEWVDGN